MSGMTKASNSEKIIPVIEQQTSRGRNQAIIILLIVILPMLVAYIMFYTGIGVPQHQVNKGNLLTPTQLPLQQLDGASWNIQDQPRKWRLLIPGEIQCDQLCEKNLYLTRQVHIRLAENAARVERIYLLLDDELAQSTQKFITQKHPHVPVLKATEKDLAAFIKNSGLPVDAMQEGEYFLMDQEGFVMMAYSPQHSGKDLLADIKRILKYSPEE